MTLESMMKYRHYQKVHEFVDGKISRAAGHLTMYCNWLKKCISDAEGEIEHYNIQIRRAELACNDDVRREIAELEEAISYLEGKAVLIPAEEEDEK